MNLRHHIRKSLSKLARFVPPAFHHQILKQYLHDRELSLRHGIVCLNQDYSSPVTVTQEINTSQLGQKRDLPGIKLDNGEFERMGAELGLYAHEFPWRSGDDKPEVPWGFMFPTLDSMVLYAMIRHFKPVSYIEVGCGHSSKVSSLACERNRQDGIGTTANYIEPYPSERLDLNALGGELIVKRIQDIPLEFFANLDSGDILFIDTSHIMKCQSDVEWELLHVLPSLRKGVIVHVHDIYTPFEYPLEWLENNYAPGQYNEQYALESLLSGGGRFKPLFPVHMMCREHASGIQTWFGTHADLSRSFWLVVD